MEGDGDDKGYDQDASIHDKAMKRQEDDYARGDVGATVENVADDVNDAVDGTDQRPPSAENPTTSSVNSSKNDVISRRDSRHTSIFGGIGAVGGGIGANQMKELMGTLTNISNQMHVLGTRLDNMERLRPAGEVGGVLGASVSSSIGTRGALGGVIRSAPAEASPYITGSPHRQPLPSSQSRQIANQLRGPPADMDSLNVFNSVSSSRVTNSTQELPLLHSESNLEGNGVVRTRSRGEEIRSSQDSSDTDL